MTKYNQKQTFILACESKICTAPSSAQNRHFFQFPVWEVSCSLTNGGYASIICRETSNLLS